MSSPSGSSAISVRNLRKTYDGVTFAVDAVDLDVPRGEVFALLGPNGAGKTTIVEILEGYRRRTSGEVSVLGMDPERGGRRLRERIGIVLQDCGIEQYLTVSEVLRMRAPLYPAPRRVDEVIELVGLKDKTNAKVRAISGGQKRRLDLALGLIGDPELVFLDEPTTGFDPCARRSSWEIIRNLARSARRCCSPPITWTRPTSSPPRWRSSPAAEIVATRDARRHQGPVHRPARPSTSSSPAGPRMDELPVTGVRRGALIVRVDPNCAPGPRGAPVCCTS